MNNYVGKVVRTSRIAEETGAVIVNRFLVLFQDDNHISGVEIPAADISDMSYEKKIALVGKEQPIITLDDLTTIEEINRYLREGEEACANALKAPAEAKLPWNRSTYGRAIVLIRDAKKVMAKLQQPEVQAINTATGEATVTNLFGDGERSFETVGAG